MRLLVDMRATDGLYRRERVRMWHDGFGIRHSVEFGERGTEFYYLCDAASIEIGVASKASKSARP